MEVYFVTACKIIHNDNVGIFINISFVLMENESHAKQLICAKVNASLHHIRVGIRRREIRQ